MSKSPLYGLYRTAFRLGNISVEKIWSYVDDGKLTETEAVLICGPRKKSAALTAKERRVINDLIKRIQSKDISIGEAMEYLETEYAWMSDAAKDVLQGFMHYAVPKEV